MAERTVRIPYLDTDATLSDVIYYTAIAGFVAVEIIEWPLALFVAAGHALATHSANPALEAAGSGAEATA